MPRPRRSEGERAAVQDAARSLSPSLSARTKAGIVAHRVVSAYLRDELRTDEFERALHRARQQINACPIEALATGEDCDIAYKFLAHRTALYRARGCQQLSGEAWIRETGMIAKEVEKTLARRFRDYLT